MFKKKIIDYWIKSRYSNTFDLPFSVSIINPITIFDAHLHQTRETLPGEFKQWREVEETRKQNFCTTFGLSKIISKVMQRSRVTHFVTLFRLAKKSNC